MACRLLFRSKHVTNLLPYVKFNSSKIKTRLFSRVGLAISLASGMVVLNEDDLSKGNESSDRITVHEPKELSNQFLLRQASNIAMDSSALILSRSFSTLHGAHQEYIMLLETAIGTLLTGLEVNEAVSEYLRIDEQLSQIQSEISTKKAIMIDSFYVYEESTKMVTLAVNISYLVGNEISSGLASSNLYNFQQEVNLIFGENCFTRHKNYIYYTYIYNCRLTK